MKQVRRLACCALLLVLAGAARADAFTERAIQAFKAADPTLQITAKDDNELLVKFASGATSTTYLDNPRKICAQHPDDCDNALAGFAKTMSVDMAKDKLEAKFTPDKLYPVLRSTSYAAQAARIIKDPAKGLVVRPFAPGVDLLFIIDGEHSVKYVTVDEQGKSGMTVDAMLATGSANAAHLPPLKPIPVPKREGLYALMFDDTLGSARLFDAALWDRIEKDAGGPVAVALPTRDWILYTRLDNDSGLAALRLLAHNIAAREAYSVSDGLVRRDGKGWTAVGER
jgi:uncharacterized protein YtpQ (UPF0354 family)